MRSNATESRPRFVESLWSLALLLGGLLAVLPLRHEFAPMVDLPEHAATVATLVDLDQQGPLAGLYEADFARTQYWLATWVAARLAVLVGGPVAALKVLLVVAVLSTLFALRRVFRAVGHDERLALCALPLLWSRPMTLGFVSFVLATPVVLFALSLLAPSKPLSVRHHLTVAGLSLTVFFLNLTSVVWLASSAVAVAVARSLTPGSTFRQRAARAALRLVGLFTLVVPTVWWWVSSPVLSVDAARFTVSMTPQFQSPKKVLASAPGWLGDVWGGRLDGLVLLSWATLVVLLGWLSLRRVGEPEEKQAPWQGSWAGRALWLGTVAVWLGLPFERGWLWGLNARFAPAAAMLLPLVLGRGRSRWHSAVLVGMLAVGVADAALVERNTRVLQEEFAGLKTVLADLPKGSRLLQLTFFQTSQVTTENAFSHASGYHRVWNHGSNEASFIDLPQSLLHYRAGLEPKTRPWPWEFNPEGYDNELEGPSYDYVLTRGDAPLVFPPGPEVKGPRWTLARADGLWALWERARP